ncbi:MAG: M48 family metallopeptidase [Clostridiales bacterium]|nr:M48 family metallopeptidase [Clostridiales bacterium]
MNINYKAVRTKRKSVAIQVTSLNEVIVRAPKSLPMAEIHKFVERKRSWISKKIALNGQNIFEREQVLSYKKILICGKLIDLEFGKENKIFQNKLVLKNKNQIRNALTQFLSPLFLAEYEKICALCNLSASTVSFKSYKARWGCCDAKNNIVFNYKLLMLPVSSWHYIIIHELCHTVHHNHSKNFWNLVSRFCKNYKKERQVLKQFAFIANFYN